MASGEKLCQLLDHILVSLKNNNCLPEDFDNNFIIFSSNSDKIKNSKFRKIEVLKKQAEISTY